MNRPVTAVEPERRLHPMSWLFVLLQQLKQFIVPLAVLLFFGRGNSGDGRDELWPLIGVVVLVAISLWQYFTYRYGIVGDHLLVRSGLLERSLRVIPFARIHNVALQQSLLHRLFGVAEVRLESAGGAKPEAQMRVLKLDDALALEALVRRGGAAACADTRADETAAHVLLTMPISEVLRLGLISNRGMIVVGAVFAGSAQFNSKLIPNLLETFGTGLFGYAGDHGFGPIEYAATGLAVFAMIAGMLRLLSMALALLQYYGFQLHEHGRRLTIERGLLAHWRTSASRQRIQAWTLHESVLHRLLKRRSLQVDTAVAEEGQPQRALRELAPIATPAACEALIEHLLPRARWSQLQWRALAKSAAWRMFLPSVPWLLIVTAALSWRLGAWGWLALTWLPWAALMARRRAQCAGYALSEELIAVREGWWSRHWRFAELDKLQVLHLTRSPIDRRCGTATLWLDTSGAGTMTPALRIRFLPQAEAVELYERLAHTLALRW